MALAGTPTQAGGNSEQPGGWPDDSPYLPDPYEHWLDAVDAPAAAAGSSIQTPGSSEEPAGWPGSGGSVSDSYEPWNEPSGAGVTTKTLRFHPLDSNNHNTILFFSNTNPVTASIGLAFLTDLGAACGSGVAFDIPPGQSARVSADTLEAGRPASWANTIVYNVFDTCEIGLVSLSTRGVLVDGYWAWTATDIYNPHELNPHAPIAFTTPPLVFGDGFETGDTSAWSLAVGGF